MIPSTKAAVHATLIARAFVAIGVWRPGALLDKVVIDKQVVIGAGAMVGMGEESVVNEQMPDKLFAGITVIGKNAYIPDRAQIGRNVLINSGRDESNFPADRIVADGKTV